MVFGKKKKEIEIADSKVEKLNEVMEPPSPPKDNISVGQLSFFEAELLTRNQQLVEQSNELNKYIIKLIESNELNKNIIKLIEIVEKSQ